MMKLMFILAAISGPLLAYFDKGATGILLALVFILLAAFFSKPRFRRKNSD